MRPASREDAAHRARATSTDDGRAAEKLSSTRPTDGPQLFVRHELADAIHVAASAAKALEGEETLEVRVRRDADEGAKLRRRVDSPHRLMSSHV